MRRKLWGLSLLMSFCVAGQVQADTPPHWTFLDIGAEFNAIGNSFFPYTVNDLGQVAGSGVQGFFGGSPSGAFVTKPNSPVNWSARPDASGFFIDQVVTGHFNNDPPSNSPDNTLSPAPRAINNLGDTTGRGYSYPHDMTFVGNHTTTTAIGPQTAGTDGYAINDSDTVAGITATAGGWTHAVRIQGGNLTDLGTFSTQAPTRANDVSIAFAINNSGVVVGQAQNDVFVGQVGNNQTRAFRWTQATGLVDLGSAGGYFSAAYDISNNGLIVGQSYDSAFISHAVLWNAQDQITILPGGYGSASFVNDAGWVVGGGQGNYFFYENGQTYNLLSLLNDDGTHWSNIVITDMNNLGQMSGYATNDNTPGGGRRAFLLTPDNLAQVPEPASTGILAIIGLSMLRRRRR